MKKLVLLFALSGVAVAAPILAAEPAPPLVADANAEAVEIGEVEIRVILPLSAAQRAQLARLAQTDPQAKALLQERIAGSLALLDRQPRPLAVIQYEGLVNTEPRRIETVKNLEDMDDAALLFETWQATGDARFAAAARRYVSAWAKTYGPTGNDVNENKLLPLLVIYEAQRDQFAPAERAAVDAWMSDIATRQIATADKQKTSERSNRYTKTLRIVATIGLALGKTEWLDYAFDGLRAFVSTQLYADGGSFDLDRRDTLTYHSSALRPLLDLAVLAARDGRELYSWKSPADSSIKRSVDYVVPYANGTLKRQEWTNSQSSLDWKRSAAGIEKYRAGRFYEPVDALELMQEAAFFDPSLAPLAAQLAGAPGQKFPTWRAVVNEAVRCAAAK